MKTVQDLKKGDYIAFGFNYFGGEPSEIVVSNITSIHDNQVLSHFMYGHHSLGEFIDKNDIIAIGNMDGCHNIKGWSGRFDIIKTDHNFKDDIYEIQ